MRHFMTLIAVFLLCSSVALAQSRESMSADHPSPILPQNFGSEDLIAEWIPLAAFQTRQGAPLAYAGAGWGQNTSGAVTLAWAPIEVPHGGRVVAYRPFYKDNAAAAMAQFFFTYYEGAGSFTELFTHVSANATGLQAPLIAADHTINYFPSGSDDPATMQGERPKRSG